MKVSIGKGSIVFQALSNLFGSLARHRENSEYFNHTVSAMTCHSICHWLYRTEIGPFCELQMLTLNKIIVKWTEKTALSYTLSKHVWVGWGLSRLLLA